MKYFSLFATLIFLSAGCTRNSSQTWEDVKTAGRYMQRGVDTLCGKDYESRMLTSNEEFFGPDEDDFIPLKDADLKNTFADKALPQPKGIPGEKGIPSLDRFYSPPVSLSSLFQMVHFQTDEHILREQSILQRLQGSQII